MLRAFFISLVAILIGFSGNFSFAQADQETAQTVVHLLNYVAMDYSGAVENGKVVDEMEYVEQQEFSQRAFDLTKEADFLSGNTKKEILASIQTLINDVDAKINSDKINTNCLAIINRIITATGMQTSPKLWPNLKNGAQLYAQNCAMCHGITGKGDGEGGKALDPVPSNFHDAELMDNFSPFQAFNSIRLGVPETGMQAYAHFSIEEIWDLAFYVKSLRFGNSSDDASLQEMFREIASSVGLDHVSYMTDVQISDTLKTLGIDADKGLKALRLGTSDWVQSTNSLPIAKKGLLDALKSYKDGDKKKALTLAISAYLEGIEPIEAQLKNINSSYVARIEEQMFKVRNTIEKDRGIEAVTAEIDKAIDIIYELEHALSDQKMNYVVTFLISLSIVLREALEAFLIIAIVISLIKSTGTKRALVWLHGGWITAVICGVLGWFLSDYILRFGGRNREIMEGLVSLFAVLILLIMGFWMHNQTHAQQWTKFVKEKIGGMLSSEKMFGLATFSFMVVFREAFEVILFLQAVNIESIEGNKSAIALGVLTAAIAITIFAYFFLKYTKKLPIRQLFRYSTWLLAVLAIVLMGKGVHSLQESGWISVTHVSMIPRIEWLGVYPTLQSFISQIILTIVIVVVIRLNNKKNASPQA